MSANSAPDVPPPTQIDVPVTPALTWPIVMLSGDVQTFDEVFTVVFVVSTTDVDVGESLQAVAITPPKQSKARSERDNIDLHRSSECRRTSLLAGQTPVWKR